MAQLDASLNEYTSTELLADRADAYRLAVRLLREAGFDPSDITPEDVQLLTQFLASDIY
jgi:hypothetical protein